MDNFKNKVKYVWEKTKTFPHNNGKSFFQHLLNTSNIITTLFPTKQYLIDAGLFHSIYGTCYYNHGIKISRTEIKSLIGNKSENLVYIFCNLENRTEVILQNKFKKDIQKDLYILEYANYLEQNGNIDIINIIKNNLFIQFCN
jgi:uncharacterized protein (DUF2164 family)